MRTSLAERSVEAFAREGFAAVSMRRLADELGVSTGTLYHYFPNKEALFEAAVTCVTEQDISEGTTLLQRISPNPADRFAPLFTLLHTNLDRLVRNYRVLAEFGGIRETPPRGWRQTVRRLRARYAVALSQALALEDPDDVDLVLLTINGMIHRASIGDRSTDPATVAATLRRRLYPQETNP